MLILPPVGAARSAVNATPDMAEIFPAASTAYILYDTRSDTPVWFAAIATVVSALAAVTSASPILAAVISEISAAVPSGTTYSFPAASLLCAVTIKPSAFSAAFTSASPPAVAPAVMIAVGAVASLLTVSVAALPTFPAASVIVALSVSVPSPRPATLMPGTVSAAVVIVPLPVTAAPLPLLTTV